MIPVAFDYERATSVDDAIAKLAGGGKALAGGHSIVPLMKLRLSEPGKLEVSSHEPTVSIGPRGRAKITLTVKDRSGQANSEAYALLVVEQIGSIVIRARVV